MLNLIFSDFETFQLAVFRKISIFSGCNVRIVCYGNHDCSKLTPTPWQPWQQLQAKSPSGRPSARFYNSPNYCSDYYFSTLIEVGTASFYASRAIKSNDPLAKVKKRVPFYCSIVTLHQDFRKAIVGQDLHNGGTLKTSPFLFPKNRGIMHKYPI